MRENQAPGPGEQGREDVKRAEEHAGRRIEELREEARQAIDRSERAAKDRDEVRERPTPPKPTS